MNSKKILVTVVAAVIVIAATFGITYAAWDKSSDSSSLNATVGNNVFINIVDVEAGDTNANLVPKNDPSVNGTIKDCLTLGAVKVTNNPINDTSSDTDSLDVIWDVKSVQVTYAGSDKSEDIAVDVFKSIFKISISHSDATVVGYNEVVPMDTKLFVLMEFIEDADTISNENANKFREAKFSVTVEFKAIKKA